MNIAISCSGKTLKGESVDLHRVVEVDSKRKGINHLSSQKVKIMIVESRHKNYKGE